MAADTEKQWTIREDGCLNVDINTNNITYNSSLNSVILSCKDHTITVIDALSGAFLQKSDLSGHKCDVVKCVYLAEKDKTVYCDGSAIGVRGDLQGILLLDTALQTPITKSEDTVKIEIPLVEAVQLRKTLLSTDLSNKEYIDDFTKELNHGIEKAHDATQGNHKTAKWSTVCLQMQHVAIKSICSALMEELTKTNQTGQGFPVASAIVDRLGFLLPFSRVEIMKEPVNRSLMYSEAARRETFANWPHMNYKWALPEPMAQAGFFHHPNLHGDDRAMCFTCNVCLVCWEPTDEPWSEHERHSQSCPYIKGDYTQNVPLTVTYATQPAQFHGDSQQKISCLSTTFNEDFIATSTRDGNIVVWDISHILKKHCQLDIDLTNTLVALKTGLQIERVQTHQSSASGKDMDDKKSSDDEVANDTLLHEKHKGDNQTTIGPHRPSDDLCVTSLCIADETKWKDELASPNPSKPSSVNDAQLSLICGVTLRQTKTLQSEEANSHTEGCCSNMTVQLMNEVNEAVSSETSISRLITDGHYNTEFYMPESHLVPYIVVVSLIEEAHSSSLASPSKKKASPRNGKPSTSKENLSASFNTLANNTDEWVLNPWEDTLDSDCQIVGFTPAPEKNSGPFSSTFSVNLPPEEKHIKNINQSSLPNGPSNPCDSVDAFQEPYSSIKSFTFADSEPTGSIKLQGLSSYTSYTSDSSADSFINTNSSHKKETPKISGTVIQCVEIPLYFQKEQIEVQSILPSVDKQHVIVILSTKTNFLEISGLSYSAETNVSASSRANSSTDSYCGGGILVYKLKSDNNRIILEDEPLVVYKVNCPKDVIKSTFLLPMEVEDQADEHIERGHPSDNQGSSIPPNVAGHIVIITASGAIQILSLINLTKVAELSPGPSEKYLCATYCSGIERLCACTDSGKLQFFDLDTFSDRKSSLSSLDPIDGAETNREGSACKKAKFDEDVVDHLGSDYLTNQPLNAEIVTQLHSLIQFENLMPRFTAVVPPCWSEIQQEQQQRRHPQHLQQQGESTQHTRTWKLITDAGQTWDEHLLEILLPKPCSVGHVDVKFSLHALGSLQPNVEVTLLKQNIGSIFCPPGSSEVSHPKSLSSSLNGLGPKHTTGDARTADEMVNNVLNPKFLESHNAEVLCGPIKLANCLDLTGTGGLVTLASPQLLNAKPRSLLLHIKGFENSPLSRPIVINKEKTEKDQTTMDKMMKSKKKIITSMYKNLMADNKHKNIKGLFDSFAQAGVDKSSSPAKQKLTDAKGCDWLQEISVTVRVFKKTSIRTDKLQRSSMIQDTNFHKRLIKLLVTASGDGILGVSTEHMQNMALEILIWILSMQRNDVEKRDSEKILLESIQSELNGMVKSCFIVGSRTTAHKFSRLLALCMEYTKLSSDPDLAHTFNHSLMQALLDCFPLLPLCTSSGAMRWFFTLLNRVKCMDMETVAEKCCDLLLSLSKQYNSRTQQQHALLKTRYGLYGNPFEAELFDMELSSITKPNTSPGSATPNTIFSNVIKSAVGGATASSNKEQPDLFDMLISPPDKNAKNQPDCLQSDILGLLEVEPLHFRCHATSDGTRMERMDATSTTSGPAPSTSAFNSGPAHLIPFQTSGLVADEPMLPILNVDYASYFATSAPKLSNTLSLIDENILKKKNLVAPSSKMYGAKILNPHIVNTTQQQLPQKQGQQPQKPGPQKQFAFPQIQGLLQAPPPQVLVIERMHSGARRFVTLDFGKPIVLTDVIIPSSVDLASLSIDVWIEGEEIDGQRLVVASDIRDRTLVMNNIMPAPVCRYLKITTVGRYSGGTTRSRIPLGSFYGHTYILPWEWPNASITSAIRNQASCGSNPAVPNISSSSSKDTHPPTAAKHSNSCDIGTPHAALLSQLALFLSLLEDLQCRFNLAKTRLETHLKVISSAQFLSSHIHYHLKRSSSGKLSEEDAQIIQTYNECLQLQLQLNLAQRAIHRLQTSLGISTDAIDETVDTSVLLAQATTDKLRVILENLLDTLLTSTVGIPAIPQPSTLYTALTPDHAQALFQHLCLHGTQRIQVSAGLLLVRVCGTQPWWGQFLGNMLQEFFHSQYSQIFPQDRVFILLCALGQKSLSGPSALYILDSLLSMLTSVLQPLLTTDRNYASHSSTSNHMEKHLDLPLISWILLFLCRNMENPNSSMAPNTDDAEKGAKRDKEAFSMNNRWGFIESQWSSTLTSGARGKSQRVYRRGFQRKVAQYRQKMHEIDRFKKLFGTNKKNPTSTKFFKGVTEQKKCSDFDKDEDMDTIQSIILSRERCLGVVRGLMALLLSMDFTCHVDLFLVACKVLAKICVACRPSINLCEVMSQEQLEQLVLLIVDTEFNHDNLSWGGAWASHAITCLLQDILEGEKTCPSSPEDSEADISDVDDTVLYTQWLELEVPYHFSLQLRGNKLIRVIPVENVRDLLETKPQFYEFIRKDFLDGNIVLGEKEDPVALVSLFLNKSDKDKFKWNKLLESVSKHQAKLPVDTENPPSAPAELPDFIMEVTPEGPTFSLKKLLDDSFEDVEPPSISTNNAAHNVIKIVPPSIQPGTIKHLLGMKNALNEQYGIAAAPTVSHTLSTALDARLEFGLETMPEHRLKVMQSLQMSNIQCAFTSPLPQPPVSFNTYEQINFDITDTASAENVPFRFDDLTTTSVDMLSQCFERMFAQLRTGRVSIESVLQLWLTLNEDPQLNDVASTANTASNVASAQVFDATRQPVIALSENAVASLIEVAVMMPCLLVRTWVYLLQSLCLLTNQRHTSSGGTETSMAPNVLNDPNLAPLLSKFLSSHPPGGAQQQQIGPAAVKVFADLLHRLHCKSIEVSGQRFKEMLLKIVYNLTAERGAIYQCCGPLDAQVQFLEMLAESTLVAVDISNALSVIQAASTLVYQHLSLQDQVVCRTSHDTSMGARSCFGGLVASLLRGSDSRPGGTDSLRDQLMFFLMQLVNKLILSPGAGLPTSKTNSKASTSDSTVWESSHISSPRKNAWADSNIEPYSPRLLINIRLSDDEKSRTLGQQLGESQVHQHLQEDSEEDVNENSHTTSEIADIVVGNQVIMQNLIQSLSHCTSNKLALMFAHTDSVNSLQKTADQTEAVTVGDLIYTVLRNLKEKCSDRNIMVDNLFRFFSGQPPIICQATLTRLSEPLLFFTLRMLNTSSAIKRFIDLGGVNVVSTNFVRCNQQMISSSPSIISTLMQNFSSGHGDLGEKSKGFEIDNTEGLQSFAHLGTITCSSPTASPADGLIQNVANRRARSATWSYHFYPDEPCVELTIHLPFAVLLKYVHIRPHGAAISTCPSHVSLELSHDGNIVTPASPPIQTSSLALIRLQLQKPEVVTSVTLLLHRPWDSMTLGLQKISLWGQTAFAENSENLLSFLNEDSFSHSSLGWMRILHHCLMNSSEDIQSTVAHTAAVTPNLLATCTSMLVHPLIGVHAPKIETILIKLGLSHNNIGLSLIDIILRQPSRTGEMGPLHSYLGKIHGAASPYTVEIIYRLGTTQDENTCSRVKALLQWLEDCSIAAIRQAEMKEQEAMSSTTDLFNSTSQRDRRLSYDTLSNPSPEHVQCVAAILWNSTEQQVNYPINRLVSIDFIRSLFNWSRVLADSNLRKAVNNLLCSACHICSNGFMYIQEWMGIVGADGSQIVATAMDETNTDNVVERKETRAGRMTDDSKEATRMPSVTHLTYSTDGMTDDSKEACRLESLSTMSLDESKLMLLATVCKSPVATRQLMNCGLPAMLAQAVCEFCNQQMLLAVTPIVPDSAEANNGLNSYTPGNTANEPAITSSLVSAILRFFTEISSEMELKNWLGQAEGNAFWSLLLTLLCGSQYQAPILMAPSNDHNGFLSSEERSELENRTIQFFSAVISFHPENQLLFAKVLCDVIKDQGTSKTELLSAMPLSGFMRRLLLQVLLEDEKITVSVRNFSSSLLSEDDDSTASEGAEIFPLTSCTGQIYHPHYGSGRSCQCIKMNLNARCSDVISKVADTSTIPTYFPEKKEDKSVRTDDNNKKEALGELDVEVMEFVTQTAAIAKEKREKSPATTKSSLPPRPPTRRGRHGTGSGSLVEAGFRYPQPLYRVRLRHIALPGKDLPQSLTLSQLLHVLSDYALLPSTLALQFVIRLRTAGSNSMKESIDEAIASDESLLSSPPFPSALKVFASVGGLALLAQHLPLLFPEISRQSSNVEVVTDNNNIGDLGHDWVTVESSDELYDPYLEPITPPHTSKPNKHSVVGTVPSIPPHSLIAFGLFLRLPGYAEVLLKERKVAQCLLRLVLGVTDDGDGGQILTSPIASSLPTMPFTVLKSLFDTSPLTTDDGVLLRRMALEIGVIHLVLACLATLSHHKPRAPLSSFQHETQLILSAMQSSTAMASLSQPEEKTQQHYWAKGTGFGTGSTTSSWDAEQAMLRQKGEEEHVACLLQVLASYMNPNGSLDSKPPDAESTYDSDSSSPSLSQSEANPSLIPDSLADLLSQSCLVPALSSYLRNDSVLDMARHVPLYRALLQLLRGITVCPSLVPILLPMEEDKVKSGSSSGESQASIETLLEKMKGCVDTYASRLKSNKGKSGNKIEDEESEGLALLIPDIQETARLVHIATKKLKEISEKSEHSSQDERESHSNKPQKTLEDQYIAAMKDLQFDTYEMVTEEGKNLKFHVSHHYESNVKATGTVTNVSRTRRLAQEAVTLSTSLPLAFSSSVFVRCDEERLDVMKVLITGPSDTPYANGCFEFDVFFPQDYPNTPPFINMETTGNHSVRFNPNLYNDGKVCLSVLNTWHGRPEEKWNAQTSSFLQVLVSIQSLILVSEPYFNEPGYERSRGTPSGAASSHEYDANIRQATVKWAMLEQLKNPSPCFKEIIQTHFWLKRHEILLQCEKWITEMECYSNDKRTGRSIAQSTLALKRHYNQLREELSKLKPPSNLELEEESETNKIDPEAKHYVTSSPDQAVGDSEAAPTLADDINFALANAHGIYLSPMDPFSIFSPTAQQMSQLPQMPLLDDVMNNTQTDPDC
ncbi:baculoviral IAP repeat-containing protein 6-like isoform X2 [Physella acuta]|uniref:baculoviral IAP repeat-containing protein 6-like isoform X2 n=1 Tax=Physella acuta TaxID=109671 RepID=UPI0027DB15D1|nr:baculoviral IAP repeat-containing protein 6-like isoform X2 [Physella acuta]